MRPVRLPSDEPKRHKYAAEAQVVDGVRFASRKEARRYGELRLLEKAGQISGLKLQPAFDLMVVGQNLRTYKIGEYVADFSYSAGPRSGPSGRAAVEDVKGFKTPLYRWKKKHFEAQYGIEIREA